MDVRYLRAVHVSLVSGGVPEQARGAVLVRVARKRTRRGRQSCTSVHGEVGRREPWKGESGDVQGQQGAQRTSWTQYLMLVSSEHATIAM